MSWSSSVSAGGPFRRVFGLTEEPGLGELPLLLGVGLSLFAVEDGIRGYRGRMDGFRGFEVLGG